MLLSCMSIGDNTSAGRCVTIEDVGWVSEGETRQKMPMAAAVLAF